MLATSRQLRQPSDGGNDQPQDPPPDAVAPETLITAGPPDGSFDSRTSPEFSFGSEPGARFECRTDESAFRGCSSPVQLSQLEDGPHSFSVRAIDPSGNVDATPAVRSWTVDTVAPNTAITSGPASTSPDAAASFTYEQKGAATDAERFECRLDERPYEPCPAHGFDYAALDEGVHDFYVRAVDRAGNTGPAASLRFSSADVNPDAPTTLSGEGVTLTVPAGTVEAPTTATIARLPEGDPDLGGVGTEAHIAGQWADGTNQVKVTMPLDPDFDPTDPDVEPAVIHQHDDGAEDILTGSSLDYDSSDGTVSIETTSLSKIFSVTLPRIYISAPSVTGTQFVRELVAKVAGLRASEPGCSPDVSGWDGVETSGSATESSPLLGAPAVLSCVSFRDNPDRARWILANNTGAVLSVEASGDARIVNLGLSKDFLTDAAFFAINGVSDSGSDALVNGGFEAVVPPSGSIAVTVPQGGEGDLAFDGLPALAPHAFLLRQLGTLLGSKSDAVSLYSALNECGYSLALSSYSDLVADLKCAKTLLGHLATPARILKALGRALFVADLAESTGESLIRTFAPTTAHLAAGSLQEPPPPPPPPTGDWLAVSAGGFNSCGIRDDKSLACWGDNSQGRSTPPVGSFAEVSTGYDHSCAISTTKALRCWGDDAYSESTPPAGSFTDVSSGYLFSCGVDTSAALHCWGRGDHGQANPPAGSYTSVSAGYYHACALNAAQEVRCWGGNDSNESTPPGGTFKAVSAGIGSSCGIRTDGTIACWGANVGGKPAPSGTFTSLSLSGFGHACAIREGGDVVCWGEEGAGRASPPGGTFQRVSSGYLHSCGVRTSGAVDCWGDHTYGQATPPDP